MRGTAVEVRFEDVRFTYPAAKGGEPNPPVLNGLSFSFRTGETVALVGASGGGKSTAARLLQRFWDVDRGRISINGTDVRELTLENLRDIVTVSYTHLDVYKRQAQGRAHHHLRRGHRQRRSRKRR